MISIFSNCELPLRQKPSESLVRAEGKGKVFSFFLAHFELVNFFYVAFFVLKFSKKETLKKKEKYYW